MQGPASTITASRSVKPATVLMTLAIAAFIVVATIALMQMGGSGATSATLGRSEAGSTVSLGVGGNLTIALPANPSTGYAWVVSSIDGNHMIQKGEPEFSPESDLIGSGGTMTFHFAGTAAGRSDLQLDYMRPWEDAEPLDTFLVTVNVG